MFDIKLNKNIRIERFILILITIALSTIGLFSGISFGLNSGVEKAAVFVPTQAYYFIGKWGSSGTGNGKFDSISGVTVDASDYIYVVERWNNRMQKFNSNGEFITKWGSYGSGNGQFKYPYGTAADSSGNIYVTEYGRLQKFNSSGGYISQWGSGDSSGNGKFYAPKGVAVDSSGNVYIAESYDSHILKFNSNGEFITKWGSLGTNEEQLDGPEGIAVDSSGNVYVVDTYNNRIQKFNSNGGYITQWGSYGSGNGQFKYPTGVTIDSSGNLYVFDKLNDWVQKFNSTGGYMSKFGTSGSRNGQFYSISGITVDSSGNVYVAGDNRIQKFSQIPLGSDVAPDGTIIALKTGLTMFAWPKKITAGGATVIKGQLKDSTGKALSDKRLKIKVGKKVIKIVKTDKNGKFKFKLKPRKTTTYKAAFIGVFGYKTTVSKGAKVVVKKAKRKNSSRPPKFGGEVIWNGRRYICTKPWMGRTCPHANLH